MLTDILTLLLALLGLGNECDAGASQDPDG